MQKRCFVLKTPINKQKTLSKQSRKKKQPTFQCSRSNHKLTLAVLKVSHKTGNKCKQNTSGTADITSKQRL